MTSEDLNLIASAARARVEQHRLEREREAALRRVRAGQNLTAAWKPLSSEFLSAKAKLQPRDSKGRWIDMGATVRWLHGSQIGGDKSKLSGAQGKKSYKQGKVTGFDPQTKKYSIKPSDGGAEVNLEGSNLEVIKAVIPDAPGDAPEAAPKKRVGDVIEDFNPEKLRVGQRFQDPADGEDGPIKRVRDTLDQRSGLDLYWETEDGQKGRSTVWFRAGGYGGKPEEKITQMSSVRKLADRSDGDQVDMNPDGEFADDEFDQDGAPISVGTRVRTTSEGWQSTGTVITEPEDHRGLWEIKMDNAGKALFSGKDLKVLDEGSRRRDGENRVTGAQHEEVAEFQQLMNDFGLERFDVQNALRKLDRGVEPEKADELFDAVEKDLGYVKPDMSEDDAAALDEGLARLRSSFGADEPPAGEVKGGEVKEGDWVTFPGARESVRVREIRGNRAFVNWPDGGGDWKKVSDLTFSSEDDKQFPETSLTPDRHTRAEIRNRAGLSDEEMADAPELLSATEELRNLAEEIDFLSPRDMADFHDYLDEVQVAPGARGPGQWDSIEDFIRGHEDSLNEDQRDQLNEAVSRARQESLDGPGTDTIDSMEKAMDAPDNGPGQVTVPAEWAKEKQFDDALGRLKPLTEAEKARTEGDLENNRRAKEAWDADPANFPELPGPLALGDRVSVDGRAGTIIGGRPDGERYVMVGDDGEKFGAHPDEIAVTQSMSDAIDELNATPAGNVTEFAKNMFQNLHPDANWDEADQTAWLDAAKKAMENPND